MKTKKRNPTVRQVEKLVEKFMSVNPLASKLQRFRYSGNSVNMGEQYVCDLNDVKEGCGTPMCHAGWYGYVSNVNNPEGKRIRHYDKGALLMAQDLGFKTTAQLLKWADGNPDIWGNDRGARMFIGSEAFNDGHTNITKLSTIISHWRKVGRRLAKLGDKKNK